MKRDMEKEADDKALSKLIDVMSELMGKDVGAVKVEAMNPKIARGAEEEMGEHTIGEGMAEKLAADHIAKDPEAYESEGPAHEAGESKEFEAGEKEEGDDDEDEDEDDMRALMEAYSRKR